MSITVPASILAETTKCSKNFRCLHTNQCGDPDKCAVESVDGKNILFLISTEHIDCSYRICFGYGQVCTCPIYYFRHKRHQGQS